MEQALAAAHGPAGADDVVDRGQLFVRQADRRHSRADCRRSRRPLSARQGGDVGVVHGERRWCFDADPLESPILRLKTLDPINRGRFFGMCPIVLELCVKVRRASVGTACVHGPTDSPTDPRRGLQAEPVLTDELLHRMDRPDRATPPIRPPTVLSRPSPPSISAGAGPARHGRAEGGRAAVALHPCATPASRSATTAPATRSSPATTVGPRLPGCALGSTRWRWRPTRWGERVQVSQSISAAARRPS